MIDIKHKHAGHVIIIEGYAFKANDAGQWDLTDIWRTLKLPKGKAPGQWRTREAERLLTMQNLHSERAAKENRLHATKRATLEYAGWVSPEFKDVVYDAFEAILEMPEVAHIVADKMRSMGNDHSAVILERSSTFNDKCDWNSTLFRKRSLSPVMKEAQRLIRETIADRASKRVAECRKK